MNANCSFAGVTGRNDFFDPALVDKSTTSVLAAVVCPNSPVLRPFARCQVDPEDFSERITT